MYALTTEEQVADIFTKALGTEKLRKFRGLLPMLELDLSLRGSVAISSSTAHVMLGDCDLCHGHGWLWLLHRH